MASLLLTNLLLVACGSGGPDPETARPAQTPAATVSNPVIGEWRRTTTCEEFVKVLTEAGFSSSVPDFVAGNGFVPGASSGKDIDPKKPCDGAVPREHSHFFTEDGLFGSRDWEGQQVDDGTYEVVDDNTLVISKEFPDVTFDFTINGDMIEFKPQIEPGCNSFRCVWSVSMAYPGLKWKRVPE